MARYGTGAGKGDGWGGPAKGAGSTSTRAEPFERGNTASAVQRDMSGAEKAVLLKEHLFTLATTAAREETQVVAATAWLDRHEGKPIARNLNLNVDDLSALDDGALDARREALEAELREAAGGTEATMDTPGPHGLVN